MGVVAIGAAGLGPALAADQVDEISDGLTAITILNINDFHGRIDGSVGLNFACTVVKEQANADAYAFLSAGDNIGASPFVKPAPESYEMLSSGVVDGVMLQLDACDVKGVARVAALVVAPDLDEARIMEALRTSIDPVFLPRPLKRVQALPRSDTGKLPRAELLKLF